MWKRMRGLTKKPLCTTHGHGQYRDWPEVGRGWGWVEVGKGKNSSNNCNGINNKNIYFLNVATEK